MTTLHERVTAAAAAVRLRMKHEPRVGIVLGSGMGGFADRVEDATRIPYTEIPGFPSTSVNGHAGELVLGRIGSVDTAVLAGRSHYYEGHDLEVVTLPVRVLAALGARELILTATVGGIRPGLHPGDLVCLSDHINLMGANPLRGIADPQLGPRFVDLTQAYSQRLRGIAEEQARAMNLELAQGVYVAMPGPSYETPAEIRMAALVGGDVVGMSTVPEAIVARQCGLELLALALVTNPAAGLGAGALSHDEVLAVGREASERMQRLIIGIVSTIDR